MEKVIGQVRDILRKEGVTGMDSINHCIAFIVCRLLDEEKCDKVGISEKYAFKNIMKDDNGDEIGDQELYDIFYRKGRPCFIGEMVNKLGFKNIKFKLVGIHNLKSIMKKLGKLDVDNLSVKYDLIGTIYEIHLKSGTSNSMRDLGQYYTHRLAINYMIKLCDIKMVDGLVEKIIDPTMGTGGFLTMAIKHLKSKYNIDWSKNKDNIIGFDIDDNVKNMALLNVFLETGELCTNTLIKQDTLHNDFKFNDGTILQKAKVILANEPMGLKNITHASCCDRIKDMKIRGTKAEPLFLQLFMEALDDDGRCAVIVPDGVLFNESRLHKNTRKHLIENFNLKKVIALNDKNFFLNTGVKTSILFFAKDGDKTKEVKFCNISIDEKEEIKEELIINVSYDDIEKNDYSLFVNRYNVEEIEEIEGVEYQKLGDICDFLKKSKRKASHGKNKGEYSFYTSSCKIKRCNEADYKDECIIIGTGGKANIKYDDNFSCSGDNFILKINNKNNNIKYVYYYLLYNICLLENGFSGSTIKHISKTYIKKIQIPIPSNKTQNKIVKRLDALSENNNTLERNITEFNILIKYYVDCHTMGCDKDKLGKICDFLPTTKHTSSIGKNTGKYRFYNSSQKNKLYLDTCEIKEESIIIGNGGGICVHYDTQFTPSKHVTVCQVIKKSKIKSKYVYYYILQNVNKLVRMSAGSTIKWLNKTNMGKMKIPIPSLKIQNKIIKYCDNINNMINNMERQIIRNTQLGKNILVQYLETQTKVKSKKKKTRPLIDIDSDSDRNTKAKSKKKKTIPLIDIDSDSDRHTKVKLGKQLIETQK